MKKLYKEIATSVVLFFGILLATLQVDWMNLLHLTPTIVGDKLSEWMWDLTSVTLDEIETEDVCLPIDTLMHEMCVSNGIDPASVSIVVTRSHEVNAYATVGNHVIVNTALIEMMENESQLCAVLGHEMAHLQLGHIRSAIRQQAALQVIIVLITGNGRSNNIGKLTARIVGNSITRAKEREADETGVRYLEAMHLDPLEMAATLEKFESYGLLSYLMTHDDSKKRAEHIREMDITSEGPFRQILSPGTWETMQEACK